MKFPLLADGGFSAASGTAACIFAAFTCFSFFIIFSPRSLIPAPVRSAVNGSASKVPWPVIWMLCGWSVNAEAVEEEAGAPVVIRAVGCGQVAESESIGDVGVVEVAGGEVAA